MRSGNRNIGGGKGKKTRGYNARAVLCAIMAFFCVVALIEILYGHFKSQAGYEQQNMADSGDGGLVSEVENSNADAVSVTPDLPEIPLQGMLEEVIDETEAAQNESVKENTENNNSADTQDGRQNDENDGEKQDENNTEKQTETNDMQIVFLGDSILDNVREYDGVAYLISKACNAKVYNMAIGGTTAALMTGESYEYDKWTSCSLLGVVHAILGNIDPQILAPYHAGELLKECDFSKTDYFVIEYGINDFLAKIPDSQYTNDGELRNIDAQHTYVGALETAIGALNEAFPTAKILLIAPHYCQFFNDEAYIGDSYSLDYGYGPMIDYSELCGYVYNHNKSKNLLYFNTIMDSGIDAYSADDYLEDGIHLTAAGRQVYAEKVAKIINEDFRKNE